MEGGCERAHELIEIGLLHLDIDHGLPRGDVREVLLLRADAIEEGDRIKTFSSLA
ncbi:hypothetical protein [Labilithrix luteola]|uniref:hypothetical protein n=1 Tax=Labilithrix luteola TaxID=1391654 RepID=UPI001474BCA8|nr:hypothetical protein [Labilithrix luteola]